MSYPTTKMKQTSKEENTAIYNTLLETFNHLILQMHSKL